MRNGEYYNGEQRVLQSRVSEGRVGEERHNYEATPYSCRHNYESTTTCCENTNKTIMYSIYIYTYTQYCWKDRNKRVETSQNHVVTHICVGKTHLLQKSPIKETIFFKRDL